LDLEAARLASISAERQLEGEDSSPADLIHWAAHYRQRLNELAVSVRLDEPGLFLYELIWSRTAFSTRLASQERLQQSLDHLRETLREELPEDLQDLAVAWTDRVISELDERQLQAVASPDAPTMKIERPKADFRSPTGRLTLSYLESLLDGDRQSAVRRILRAIDEGFAAETIYEEVLIPALRHAGDLWHRNELIVAQEHFVTETTLSVMAMIAGRVPLAEPNGCTVLVAAVSGNPHSLGAQAVGDTFERDGWNVIFLGSDLPPEEIVLGIEAFGPDLVALSASLTVHLRGIAATLSAIRQSRPDVKTLVGGRVFTAFPHLAKRVGADAMATTPREALEIASELVRVEPTSPPADS